jgi:hypothetical protein
MSLRQRHAAAFAAVLLGRGEHSTTRAAPQPEQAAQVISGMAADPVPRPYAPPVGVAEGGLTESTSSAPPTPP